MSATMLFSAFGYFLLLVTTTIGQPVCDEVCYERVGCYDNCPPFEEFPLPKSPDEINTQFRLFTSDNPVAYEMINETNLGVYFDGNRETKFLVHGFSEGPEVDWIVEMKDELLVYGDFNVIIVDWKGGALPDIAEPAVLYPASNTRVVGMEKYLLTIALEEQRQLDIGMVHSIGFSAGAHACGYFGKRFLPLRKIGRISGCDPAGSIQYMEDPRGRLDKMDATYVDAIHTNAWGRVSTSGNPMDIGDVDFWPNKGEFQPGCSTDVCCHLRGNQLYKESINSACPFTSDPCASLDDMRNDNCVTCSGADCGFQGYHSIGRNSIGNYVLQTNGESPFCIN